MKVRRVRVRWFEFVAFADSTGLPRTYELVTAYARTKGDPQGSESSAPDGRRPANNNGNGSGGSHEGLPAIAPALLLGTAYRLGQGTYR